MLYWSHIDVVLEPYRCCTEATNSLTTDEFQKCETIIALGTRMHACTHTESYNTQSLPHNNIMYSHFLTLPLPTHFLAHRLFLSA